MAKRQKQNGEQRQLLVIFTTICLVVVSVLMRLDSANATSISLNGNGNLLQQQQQQGQHMNDNVDEHNYVMDQQRATTTQPNSRETLDDIDDEDDTLMKSNGDDLTRSQLIFGHPYQTLTMVKRAPSGFVGMRGKKDFYEEEDNEENENSIRFPWEQIQNPDEDITWDEYAKPNGRRYKKAPTAFYGVRGKKFASINGANPNNDNHRWQDFLQKFEEDRMRDVILQDFIERLGGSQDLQGEMAKRAPTGFTGMRGKRPTLDDEASSMESLAKRGLGNNAFVGVRGKKDVSHQTFKRSPNSESSSVGGGNRQRFTDFGNKFVAVRGKKASSSSTYYNNRLPSSSSASASDNVRLLYGNSDKRTPSGFLGMRGKRPFSSDDV